MDLDYGAICVTIPMVDLREYLDLHGPQAAAKIATALTRLSLGNMSNVKGAGSGVFELRIDFGPGTESISARMAIISSSCSARYKAAPAARYQHRDC
jgi:putative component of toxin-antitoxin plasmid stabilization module